MGHRHTWPFPNNNPIKEIHTSDDGILHKLGIFGLPHAIVSDNGTQFVSQSIVEFLSGLGIQNNFASVSHPASNELAEVMNCTIFEGLKKNMEENKSE
jgi:hypothetical protein